MHELLLKLGRHESAASRLKNIPRLKAADL